MTSSKGTQPSQRTVLVVLGALTLLFWLQAARTHGVFSATVDEGRHVAASVELYQTGEFTLFYTSPLPRYFIGLLPFLDGTRVPAPDDPTLAPYLAWVFGHHESAFGLHALEQGRRYWRTLTLARIGTLAFVPLLLWLTYRWSSLIFGTRAGLGAAAIVALSPNMLAHGALATTDLATATFLTAAAFGLWRWAENRDGRSAVLAGAAVAAAMASKVPAVGQLLLVILAFTLIPTANGRSAVVSWPSWREALRQIALFAGTALVTLWASYRFTLSTLVERVGGPVQTIDQITSPGSAINQLLHGISEVLPIPMPAYFHGLSAIWIHSQLSWTTFFFGETTQEGIWYYYPVAFLLKSTLPFLLLIGLALLALPSRTNREQRRLILFPLAAGAAILALSALSKANIGIRHALVLIPLLAILASSLFAARFEPRKNMIGLLALGLLGWHAIESTAAHPDYLPYFNQLVRTRAHEVLLDSNLDWGQDLARLSRHAEDNGIDEITLSVFGARYGSTPAAVGLHGAEMLEYGERPTGWFAVSYNHLVGLGMRPRDFASQNGFDWLSAHQPEARIGRSILLYHLP